MCVYLVFTDSTDGRRHYYKDTLVHLLPLPLYTLVHSADFQEQIN